MRLFLFLWRRRRRSQLWWLPCVMLVCILLGGGVAAVSDSPLTRLSHSKEDEQTSTLWAWPVHQTQSSPSRIEMSLAAFSWRSGQEFDYDLVVRNLGREPFVLSRYRVSQAFEKGVRLWRVGDTKYYRLVERDAPIHVTPGSQDMRPLEPGQEVHIRGGGSLAKPGRLRDSYFVVMECAGAESAETENRLVPTLPEGSYGVQGACLVHVLPTLDKMDDPSEFSTIAVVFNNIIWLDNRTVVK